MCKLSDTRHWLCSVGLSVFCRKSNAHHQTRNAHTTVTCIHSVGLSGHAMLVTGHTTLVTGHLTLVTNTDYRSIWGSLRLAPINYCVRYL